MTTPAEALTARWRRLRARVDEVRAAVDSPDPHGCPDAVAGALDALYDLWVVWTKRTGLIATKDQDNAVRRDSEGELTAALVHARGSKSHVEAEFGDFDGDGYSDSYFSHYGCWRWQSHSDPDPRFAQRDTWYAAHVAHREVVPVLEGALIWLQRQPQL